MGKIIKLRSRGGHHSLSQLIPINSDNDNVYKFVTDSDYIRCGYNNEDLFFIDPPGGPFLSKGVEINGRIIKAIDYSSEIGYIITFE